MCDTLFVRTEQSTYFGKNSDRNKKEAQTLELAPARAPAPRTRVGSVEFELPDRGLAFAASLPGWMEGAEMGVNAAGVAIGNEAVFSRFKKDMRGIPGMYFLKAALMSARSAEEAREILINLTEHYSQGGKCSYKGSLVYDNAYLIADRARAFVLETAGHLWAWKESPGLSAISNSYSITEDYKRLDPESRKYLAPVNEQMACLDEADAGRLGVKTSWKRHVESGLMQKLTKGDKRQAAALAELRRFGDPPTQEGTETLFSLLRSHGGLGVPGAEKLPSLCFHDRDLLGNPTTASLAVVQPADTTDFVVWFTGAPYPCANLYKPVLCAGGSFAPLWETYDYEAQGRAAAMYWNYRRDKARRIQVRHSDTIAANLKTLQREVCLAAYGALYGTTPLAQAKQTLRQAVEYWDGEAL